MRRRRGGLEKKVKQNDKEAILTLHLIETAISLLEKGQPARDAIIDEEDSKAWRMLQLLTSKPVLFVANVDEEQC